MEKETIRERKRKRERERERGERDREREGKREREREREREDELCTQVKTVQEQEKKPGLVFKLPGSCQGLFMGKFTIELQNQNTSATRIENPLPSTEQTSSVLFHVYLKWLRRKDTLNTTWILSGIYEVLTEHQTKNL